MSITLTQEDKNVVTLTYYIKQGVDPRLIDMKDFTFNDVILPDGTALKDMTFAEFQDMVWDYENKNNITLTLENKN
jgi:hypothetical protein